MSEIDFSWINAKRSDVFFRKYAIWCEHVRQEPLTSRGITAAYKNVVEEYDEGRNASIVRYKLLVEAYRHEGDLLVDEYYEYLDKLKQSGFWIEKALSSAPSSNENSFLAAQGFSYKLGEDADLIKKVNSRASIERARKNLIRIFKRIDQFNTGTSDFSEVLKTLYQPQEDFFVDQNRLDAVAAIHFEITDNIDHWMTYPENPRLSDGSQSLLGDTLVFEIRFRYVPNNPHLDILDSLKNYFSDSPPEYLEFAKSTIEDRNRQGIREKKLEKRGFRFIEFNYFDNGRGIEQNFQNFGTNQKYESLMGVIERNQSTRKFAKAGLGYSKVIRWSEQESGLFLIHSGDEIVSNLKYRNRSLSSRCSEEYYPGTQCSILIAV